MILRKRTKLEAIGIALLFVCISVGSVFGTILKDPVGTTPGNGFVNPNYIWNSNGQTWTATGPNIQASLNLSGTTYLPSKTLYINTSLLMRNNSCLIGQGWTTVIKAGAGLGTVPMIMNEAGYPPAHTNHDIEVRNLQLDGSDPTHSKSTGYNYGVLFAKVTWGTVDNVLVRDLGKDGVRAYNSNHISFSYITGNNTGIHTAFLGYGTDNSSISHINAIYALKEAVCVEWPNPTTGKRNEHILISDVSCFLNEQHGLFIQDSNWVTVSNYIADNTSAVGVYISVNCSNIDIMNCQINSTAGTNGGDGFYVAATGTNNIHFTNCIADDIVHSSTGYTAFNLNGNNITLTNCQGTRCGPPFKIGSTARNVTIASSTFANYGVMATIYGKDIRLTGNRFLYHSATLTAIITVDAGAKRVSIIGNDFSNAAATTAKVIDSSDYAEILNNLGFPTSFYFRKGGTIPMGYSGAYSTSLVLHPETQSIASPIIWFRNTGKINASETVTLQFQANFYTGRTAYINKTIVGPYNSLTYWWNMTDSDWYLLYPDTMYKGGEQLQRLTLYAKTTNASSSSTAAIAAYLLILG